MIAAAMTMDVDDTLATIVVIVSVLTGLGGVANENRTHWPQVSD